MYNFKPKLKLDNAIKQIKMGNTIIALKELYEIIETNSNINLKLEEKVLKTYTDALNILFDINLASMESNINYENETEIQTSILIIILDSIYDEIETRNKKTDVFRNKSEIFYQMLEKWTYKILNKIKNTKLRKIRFRKKNFEEINTSFGVIQSYFNEISIPILEKISKNPFHKKKYIKLVTAINKEFIKFYFKQIKKEIQRKNLLEVYKILNLLYIFINSIKNNSKMEKKYIKIQEKIQELEAYYSVKAGHYFQKNGELNKAITEYKIAYNQYKILENNSKKAKTKKYYLKSCEQSAKKHIKQGQKLGEKAEIESAIYHFNKAINILEGINAKHELFFAKDKMNKFFLELGNKEFKSASKISINTNKLEKINEALHYYTTAKEFYYKAQNNSKKFRETKKLIKQFQKLKIKILKKRVNKNHKNSNFEEEFLFLEELHYLSYETNNSSKAMNYARQLEDLKNKVNFNKIEKLRTKLIQERLWIRSDSSNKSKEANLRKNQIKNSVPVKNRKIPDLIETTINKKSYKTKQTNVETLMAPSHVFNTQFIIPIKENKLKSADHPTTIQQVELKNIYKIVKKYNTKGFLTKKEIKIIFSYGVNLKKESIYYHKYPRSKIQFYVYTAKNNTPRVLMIPTKNLIKRKEHLGDLVNRIKDYIPIVLKEEEELLNPDLLKDHINFAINYPTWSNIMDGFQYSTINIYFNFLHAIRLFYKKKSNSQIATFINSSIIAEKINVQSEKLEEFLQKIRSIKFLSEIIEWDPNQNQNFTLFFTGIYFLLKKKTLIACIFWNLLEIS